MNDQIAEINTLKSLQAVAPNGSKQTSKNAAEVTESSVHDIVALYDAMPVLAGFSWSRAASCPERETSVAAANRT